MSDMCDLCHRAVPAVTKHHLIPKERHNKQAKRAYGEDCKMRIGWFCVSCHRQVHCLFTNKELEKKYNTIESLLRHPEVAKYVEWIKGKPPTFLPRKGTRKTRV